jgi:hypothetical protein
MTMDMARDDRSLDLVTEHYRGRDAVGDVRGWGGFGLSFHLSSRPLTHYFYSFDFNT